MSITFEEFKKVEIRIGKILSAEKVPDTDKLLKLQVDFGEKDPKTNLPAVRQVISGIAESWTSEELVGKKLPFIINLEYRKFKGEESQGMLMATGVEGKVILLEPSSDVPEGTEVV
jgi:methionine--tRNA ligase beta chain